MFDDYLLTLSSVEYINFREKYLLLEYFGSAADIFKSGFSDIHFSGIIKSEKAYRLSREIINPMIKKDIQKLGIKYLGIYDRDYPESLRNIYDPPVVLYLIGKIPECRKIGVVGSRNCRRESAGEAYELSRNLAEKGFCVVSGMARGIDSAAHRGALSIGKTIAVMGTGVDVCYPPENGILKKEIENNGCVVSEYVPGKGPSKYSFPARNRIISGLSEAVVVSEAGEKSGALITAEFALEQGRDVFVLGGKNGIYGSGTRKLHDDGATVITNDEMDIF